MVDAGSLARRETLRADGAADGALVACRIRLSPWVMAAVEGGHLLTLNRRYFDLKSPMDRRLYQIIRKHCGDQGQWEISLRKLHLKSGAQITESDFRRRLRQFVARWERLWDEEGESFLGYRPEYDVDRDVLRVRTPPKPARQIETFLALPATPDPEMVTIIRTEMPGYDPYPIHEEWRKWTLDADADLRNPGGALRGFCRQKAKQLPDVRPGSREWTRAFS